jgi:hypothetical protein
MAGHPSVKKRQKELERKERQAEKLAKRDERRVKRNDPNAPEDDGILLEGIPLEEGIQLGELGAGDPSLSPEPANAEPANAPRPVVPPGEPVVPPREPVAAPAGLAPAKPAPH